MNRDFLRLWADTLESGKYQQGRGRLRKFDATLLSDRFCVLGVACDIAVKNNILPISWLVLNDDYYIGDAYRAESLLLPTLLAGYIGCSTYGSFGTFDTAPVHLRIQNVNYESLSQANDFGESFSDMANILRLLCGKHIR